MQQITEEWQKMLAATQADHDTVKLFAQYHPLVNRLTSYPLNMALARGFEFKMPNAPQEAINEFTKAAMRYRAKESVVELHRLKKIYGASSMAVVINDEQKTNQPIDYEVLAAGIGNNLSFNSLDPMITAGSLVSSLDPNSARFLRPVTITSQGRSYHASRCIVVQNEGEPADWISYNKAAYGFLARSDFVRALPLLQVYLRLKIAEMYLADKVGVMVVQSEGSGAVIDHSSEVVNEIKRISVDLAETGNVLSIGLNDKISTLDVTNANSVLVMLNDSCITAIATACGNMPAGILKNEALAQGRADGTHDKEMHDLFYVQIQDSTKPTFDFVDNLIIRAAWTREFVERIKVKYRHLQGKSYAVIMKGWMDGYERVFLSPSVPSEEQATNIAKQKIEALASSSAMITASVKLGAINSQILIEWQAKNINDLRFFPNDLNFDDEELLNSLTQEQEQPDESEQPDEQQFTDTATAPTDGV